MKNIIFALAAVSASLFASTAFAQEPATMRVCTGLVGGNYEYTAKALKAQLTGEVNIEIVNTTGSMDNLKKMNSGECDAGMVQSDAVYVYNKDVGAIEATKAADMYREYAHLLCRRDADISAIDYLTDKTKVLLGPNGSGSQVTWRGMVLADKEFGGDLYSKIPTINGKGKAGDLAQVIAKKATCMFYVGTPGNQLMARDANKLGDDLSLVTIKDKDFDDPTIKDEDGDVSIWTPAVLPSNAYDKIMPSGMFGNKSLDTVGVTAMFYISDAFETANDDAFGKVVLTLPDVKKNLKADKGLSLD